MSAYQASFFTAVSSYNLDGLLHSSSPLTCFLCSSQDGDGDAHARRLVDIHGERLEKMDKYGVDFNILSMTAPGIQGKFSLPRDQGKIPSQNRH